MAGRKRRASPKDPIPQKKSCRKKLKLKSCTNDEDEKNSGTDNTQDLHSKEVTNDETTSVHSDDSEFWSPVPVPPVLVPDPVKGKVMKRKLFEAAPKQPHPLKPDGIRRIEMLNHHILTGNILSAEYIDIEREFSGLESAALRSTDEQSTDVNEERNEKDKFKYQVRLTEELTEAQEAFERSVPIIFSQYEAQMFMINSFDRLSKEFTGGDVSRPNINNPPLDESEEYGLSFLDKLPRTTMEQKMEYVSDQPAPSSASQEQSSQNSESFTDSQEPETDCQDPETEGEEPETECQEPSSASQVQAEEDISQEKYMIPTRMPLNFDFSPYVNKQSRQKLRGPNAQASSQDKDQLWINARQALITDIDDPARIMSKEGKIMDFCKTMLNEEKYYRRALKWNVTNTFLTGGISNLRTQLPAYITSQETAHKDQKDLSDEVQFNNECKKECLPSRFCIDMWNEILEEAGFETKFIKKGSGWLLLTTMFSSLVGRKWYPPDPAINKIMLELEKCDDPCMRIIIFTNLLHTFSHFRAGPGDEDASRVYLDIFNNETLNNRTNRQIGDLDASWAFLAKLLEVEPASDAVVWTRYDEVGDREDGAEDNSCALRSIYDISPPVFLLSYLVQILETDWRLWVEHYYVQDKINILEESSSTSHQPLALKMLFSKEGDSRLDIRWNKRCITLCQAYIKHVVDNPDSLYLSYLRRLVDIVAEVFVMKHIANNKVSSPDTDSIQMTRLLANLFYDNLAKLNEDTLKQELYMITPAWLSSQISTHLLCLITNTSITSKSAELSDITAMFINVQTYEKNSQNQCLDHSVTTDMEPKSTTGTPSSSNKPKISGNARVTAVLTNAAGKKRSVPLNKGNQYGELPLHMACKKNNLVNVREILNTTGVNVNVTDNNMNTPLHEAVEHGYVDIVKELLNFKPPYPSVQNFFSPKTEKTNTSNNSQYVNILAFNADGMSPLHYAIDKKNAEILEMILQCVVDNQDNNKFPSLVEVLFSHHYKGSLLTNLSDDLVINSVLSRYQSMANQIKIENGGPSKPTTNAILNSTFESRIYQDVLKNAIVMYIADQQVYTAYRMYKNLSTSDVTNIHIKNPTEMERYPPMLPDFKLGQTIQRFLDGKEGSTNSQAITKRLVAKRNVTVEDIKTMENLLYYWVKMKNCDMGNKMMFHLDLFYPEHCSTKKK